MIYKSNVQICRYNIARLGDKLGEVVREGLSEELGNLLGPKLNFTLPAVEDMSMQAIYGSPLTSESITAEFVFMPIEHWQEVKRMLMILVEIVPLMSHRQLLYAVIDEIENK